jgi:hypothetical protein
MKSTTMAVRLTAATAAALALLGAPPAGAHHTGVGGGSGDGGILTIGAATLAEGQIAASITYEFIRMNQLGDATLIANPDVHGLRSIATPAMSVAYGVTDDFTVAVRLPWVQRSGIRVFDGIDLVDRGGTSGVGDVTVLGQYRFFNDPVGGTQIAALFGVKAPTGRSNLVDPFGEVFEAEFQPGFGSWDVLVGAAFSQRINPSMSFHANVLGVVTGTGVLDTNLGNRLIYNAAVTYRLFGAPAGESDSHNAYAHAGHRHGRKVKKAEPAPAARNNFALDAILELNGETHAKSVTAGVADPNSGGTTVYVSPGLRLSMNNWSGFATVGVPVINRYNGVQAEPSWRVMTGVSVAFGR